MSDIENKARDATQAALNRGEIPIGIGQLSLAYQNALASLRTQRSINRVQRRRAALEGIDLGGES